MNALEGVEPLVDPDGDETHDYHGLSTAVRDGVSVCDDCADVFDYGGHPGVRSLVDDDELLTL